MCEELAVNGRAPFSHRWALALTPESLPMKRPPPSKKKKRKKKPSSCLHKNRVSIWKDSFVLRKRGPRQKRERAWMGEGVWWLGFVWMAGIRRGGHKFSRGLLGTGVCAWRTRLLFTVKCFPPLHPSHEVEIITQHHFAVKLQHCKISCC